MSQKPVTHTPEPWVIDEPIQIWAPSIGQYVAITDVEPELNVVPREVQEANARRIVACVNACAGLPTASLEEHKAVFIADHTRALYQLHVAKQQRDELLAALKDLMDLESRGRIMPIGREWDNARAAIAKAEQP